MPYVRYSLPLLIVAMIASSATLAVAQRQDSKSDPVPKEEIFTLRYKPQLGTTLYDAETVVMHHLENGVEFPITSHAQLAWKNISVDLNNSVWTFDRYYTRLNTIDRDTTIKEIGCINKVSRLTYSMVGEELKREVIDTSILSEDAQFLSYFFRAPKMMLPLPLERVTYGATWTDVGTDTIAVPGGSFIYRVGHTYHFDRLIDTLDDGHAAVITSEQTGLFEGVQQRVGEQRLSFTGPITGADTTYLNLLTGRVVLRISHINIPVHVEAQEGLPSSDILDVRSVYAINRSNMRGTRNANGAPR